jgi:hypothetical protein
MIAADVAGIDVEHVDADAHPIAFEHQKRRRLMVEQLAKVR